VCAPARDGMEDVVTGVVARVMVAAVMVTMATATAATAAVVIAAVMAAEAGRAPAVVAMEPCKTLMAMRVAAKAMGGAEGMKQKRGGRCLRGG